ncbi:chromosome partitioning protein ParA [Bizionia gelidisalsuginis]|uniref:Chromosome partitioning protein ParA n=1 Tax=Bizionia gelidisalsuginis TaxID=291188 RepID=A0ABY3MC16_9FLAO|nr:chromosome partitioning protein ParA [Bizionia gelidisalsuginis]TYC14865.1 chromosome partitioning protein ParA [Bizionia gelidisalsuginis]
MTNNTANTGLKVALGIAIVLFIGLSIFSSSLYKNSKETEKQLTEEKATVLKDLTAMSAQYEVAMGESRVVNQNLVEAKARIDGLIDSLKVSETNIKSLWRYKSKYIALQKEMDIVLAENDELKVRNVLLSSSLDSTKVRLEERTMFTDSLLMQNTELANVVENASVLNALNLKGFGVIERSSGKLIPTERARRSDKLRICFTVAKNKLVKAGDKELYVQVIDPKNNILGANEQITFGEDILNYSVISKFNYEDVNLDICEFIINKTDNDFEEGRYRVNVFNGADLVSSSQFILK